MPHAAPSPDTRVLLIGAGNIAVEYVKALRALGINHIGVLSRSVESAQKLGLERAHGGGEEALPALISEYDAFIVAAPIEKLKNYAELFAKANASKVLLEKPAFLFSSELAEFRKRYPAWNASIALNRLYFPSITRLREIMKEEGVVSVHFSFTEWVHRIDPSRYPPIVTQRWGLSNCIHVIATVFDMIGSPKELKTSQSGKGNIPWHPAGSLFEGEGVSEHNIPFTYHSDWQGTGRWLISVRTKRGQYDMAPMEGITFTAEGSSDKEIVMAPWSGETKCGFVPLLASHLAEKPLCDLEKLLSHTKAIERIFAYPPVA